MININRETYNEKNVLDQFRCPFWLNRNPRWYVAYSIDDALLYTVPHFAPRMIKHSSFSKLSHSTTLPIEQDFIYYDRINELELDSNDKSSYRYTHVQRLILSIATIDTNVIDISKVEYLCVKSSSWSLKKLIPVIKNSMPQLYHLKIDCTFSVIQSSDIIPLTQIRILDLPELSCSLNNDGIDLSSLFPCIERLTIAVSNLQQMARLIDRFIHLSNGSFHILSNTFTEPDMMRKWFIENTNRLGKNNSFTYRLDSQSDVWIHLWISSENIQPMFKDEQLIIHKETSCSRCCSLQ
jgi:hypothetical protein